MTVYYRIGKHEEDRARRQERKEGVNRDAPRVAWVRALVCIPPEPSHAPAIGYRAGLTEAQRRICPLCQDPLAHAIKGGITTDHVVPKSRGGWEWGNRLRVHADCNHKKGDDWPTGCELIHLMVANSRLLRFMRLPTEPEVAAKKRAKNQRKRHNRAARNRLAKEMQAFVDAGA